LKGTIDGFGDFFHVELLDFIEDEDGALVVIEAIQNRIEEFAELSLFNLFDAIGRRARDGGLRRRDLSANVRAPPVFRGQTNRNSIEPRAKGGVSAKVAVFAVSHDEQVLADII
jgi:hypothetical protein